MMRSFSPSTPPASLMSSTNMRRVSSSGSPRKEAIPVVDKLEPIRISACAENANPLATTAAASVGKNLVLRDVFIKVSFLVYFFEKQPHSIFLIGLLFFFRQLVLNFFGWLEEAHCNHGTI